MIDDAGQPRICDFGLLRTFYDASDENHRFSTVESDRTVRYLAPEVVRDGFYPTVEIDVYALGCLGLFVGPLYSILQRPLKHFYQFVYLHHPYSERKRHPLIIRDIVNEIPPTPYPPDPSMNIWPSTLR